MAWLGLKAAKCRKSGMTSLVKKFCCPRLSTSRPLGGRRPCGPLVTVRAACCQNKARRSPRGLISDVSKVGAAVSKVGARPRVSVAGGSRRLSKVGAAPYQSTARADCRRELINFSKTLRRRNIISGAGFSATDRRGLWPAAGESVAAAFWRLLGAACGRPPKESVAAAFWRL